VIHGLATVAASTFRTLPALCAATLIAGSAWIMFVSLINVLLLNHAADWVRARVLSFSILVVQGAVAAGSAAWGAVAARFGLHSTLLFAGAGTVATTARALFLQLPDATVDLTAWNHWPLPSFDDDSLPAGADSGPVLVTVEYDVAPENAREFVKALRRYGRIRRRDGAMRWGMFRDLEKPDRYVETFIVVSWAEHLRQHDRFTHADRELEERLYRLIRGSPMVRHLVSAGTDR